MQRYVTIKPYLLSGLCSMVSFPFQRESPGNLPAGKRYKNVMGTDGDLRKLKLSKAKTLLRNFGVAEEEVYSSLVMSSGGL